MDMHYTKYNLVIREVNKKALCRAMLRAHQYRGEGAILNEYDLVFTSLMTSFLFLYLT